MMKTKRWLITIFAGLIPGLLHAQVGIGTDDPNAMLDVRSENSGILIPRMTAVQIEQITAPSEGELVFSTSDTGVEVDRRGFWFYNGASWVPIIAESSVGESIYNKDDVLLSNRTVTLDGHNLDIGPGRLFVKGDDGFVGINTDQPTERLDVDGQMRVRGLTEGNVITTVDGHLSLVGEEIHRYGDIRFSYRAVDHDGWYLLNGRSLSTLPPQAQATATSLGIAGNLPNANNSYISQGSPGTLSGATSVVVAQTNFPSFTVTGNTTFSSHNHSLVSPGRTLIVGTDNPQTAAGNVNAWQLAGGAQVGSINSSQTYTTTAAGAHSHTLVAPTRGGGTPIPLNPSYVQLNYFIYLGR